MGSEDLDLDMLGRAVLCLAKQEGNHMPPNCSLLHREPLSQTPRPRFLSLQHLTARRERTPCED